MASKVIKQIYEKCRDSRDENGQAALASKDVAKILRARFADLFPGVKFSIRSDYNSVNVSWVDYPPSRQVEEILCEYKFGGFDGMIDMAYSGKNWLHPDGSMSGACCEGTTGSMGTVKAFATDCPVPGAVLCWCGPRYVFGYHSTSEAVEKRAAELVLARFGGVYDDSKNPIDQKTSEGDCMWDNRIGWYWNEALNRAILETRGISQAAGV
jgi:hypothetical protein